MLCDAAKKKKKKNVKEKKGNKNSEHLLRGSNTVLFCIIQVYSSNSKKKCITNIGMTFVQLCYLIKVVFMRH